MLISFSFCFVDVTPSTVTATATTEEPFTSASTIEATTTTTDMVTGVTTIVPTTDMITETSKEGNTRTEYTGTTKTTDKGKFSKILKKMSK